MTRQRGAAPNKNAGATDCERGRAPERQHRSSQVPVCPIWPRERQSGSAERQSVEVAEAPERTKRRSGRANTRERQELEWPSAEVVEHWSN